MYKNITAKKGAKRLPQRSVCRTPQRSHGANRARWTVSPAARTGANWKRLFTTRQIRSAESAIRPLPGPARLPWKTRSSKGSDYGGSWSGRWHKKAVVHNVGDKKMLEGPRIIGAPSSISAREAVTPATPLAEKNITTVHRQSQAQNKNRSESRRA